MELEDMGRIVTAVLEFAESRAKRHIPMTTLILVAKVQNISQIAKRFRLLLAILCT